MFEIEKNELQSLNRGIGKTRKKNAAWSLYIVHTCIRYKNRSLAVFEMQTLITLRDGKPPTYDAPKISQGVIAKIIGLKQ